MTAVGGSIQELSIAGRNFAVAADADVTRGLGGFSNEIQSNGNGTARLIKTRNPWKLGGITVEADDTRDDHGFLQDIADRKGFVPVDITYASGVVESAEGQITEEIEWSSQNTLATITLSGGGRLTQQQ